ncbi:hypothetical protein [Tenacibaculum aiptasiae]|uniref:hypothetical protein n=1 Tax=Tenacibaculum aiptasiae TaxID=426481 RepID=UPI00232BC1A9|nr:hypothetical protein [Tenacibaculum aiptasiae]
MKEKIKIYILIKWWIPVLLFILSALIFIGLISSTDYLLSNITNIIAYLLLSSVILLFIAAIWQLIKGKWYLGILQLAVLFLGIKKLIFIITFMSMFGPDTDTFADNLTIPENVVIDYPIDLEMGENFEAIRPDSLNLNIKKTEFQLYNSFQPGLYEFDVWLNSDQNGTLFLKAFEITQEIELSTSRLKESSTIRIENTNGKTKKFGTKDHFTIYEGDWGEPYGARFEVWFKADNQNKEIKLFEKNYVIEGWMR